MQSCVWWKPTIAGGGIEVQDNMNMAAYVEVPESDLFSVDDGRTVYDVRTFYCDKGRQSMLEQIMLLLKTQIT